MQSLYRQRGLGAIGWMSVLLLFSFFLTCFFKLFPIYFSAWEVRSIITEVVNEPEVRSGDIRAVRSVMQRRFDTNRVEAIQAKDVKITEKNGVVTVDAAYEKRVPLLFNIDVVVKFDTFVFEVPAGP